MINPCLLILLIISENRNMINTLHASKGKNYRIINKRQTRKIRDKRTEVHCFHRKNWFNVLKVNHIGHRFNVLEVNHIGFIGYNSPLFFYFLPKKPLISHRCCHKCMQYHSYWELHFFVDHLPCDPYWCICDPFFLVSEIVCLAILTGIMINWMIVQT